MKRVFLLAGAGVALAASPAAAQRTDDNATRSADDAFGTSVGDDSIGIYSPFNVRGFSPVDAGNVRIEGLYFDQQASLTSRLVRGSTVRVGISAQSYPFPAPTGIGDYALRKPGARRVTSFGASYGPYGGWLAEVDAVVPIDGERLGIAAGAGIYRTGTIHRGTPEDFSMGAVVRWAPTPGIEIMPFWSRIRSTDSEAQPLIFSAGSYLPRPVTRNRFLGQDWADFDGEQVNYGVVARANPLGFDVRLGAFRSVSITNQSASDLLFDTDQTGRVGQRVVVLNRDNYAASTSGELRVSRSFTEGQRRHSLIASVRARAQDRRYGGAAAVDLGVSTTQAPDPRPEPTPLFGPKTQDRVRQTTLGLAYQLRWLGLGELSLGIQKTDYVKRVTNPNPAILLPETRDAPWLPSAMAAFYLTQKLAIYGGYTEGLEESPVAPAEATNRNEAPPALRTRQVDAGIRWTIGRVTAVAGVFEVEKPYFNLDGARRFRQIGRVTHRGIELSLAGEPLRGLNIVAGTLLLDAKLSGEEVSAGLIAPRPVSTFIRYTIASVDYAVPFVPGLSINAFYEATSDRVANRANTLFVPARSVTTLGARYRFTMAGMRALVRAQVGNITDRFGWANGSSGLYVPNGPRRYSISLAVDA